MAYIFSYCQGPHGAQYIEPNHVSMQKYKIIEESFKK